MHACINVAVTRFKGKGIVTTAGGIEFFTSAYVNLRAIRESVKCTLPIEVFYAGPKELSPEIISHMHSHFDNIKFIDITKAAIVKDISMTGYQIKIFSIILSSFEEVLFLDADDYPLADPSSLFNSKAYMKTGALFWPDVCVIHTAVPVMWEIMGLEVPKAWPPLHEPFFWPDTCNPDKPFELESGQLVVNKRRVWAGLLMTAFINRNHRFFFDRIIHGDKQTFSFGFNASETPYSLVNHHQYGIGLVGTLPDSSEYFCSTTSAQRHPDTGAMLFLHRGATKYKWTFDYLMHAVPTRAWSHMSIQDKHRSGVCRMSSHFSCIAAVPLCCSASPVSQYQRLCFFPTSRTRARILSARMRGLCPSQQRFGHCDDGCPVHMSWLTMPQCIDG